MGVVFLEHLGGGGTVFICSGCKSYLTNHAELLSTRFTGATGRAFLFNRVTNLLYSKVHERIMITGRHMVSPMYARFIFLMCSI